MWGEVSPESMADPVFFLRGNWTENVKSWRKHSHLNGFYVYSFSLSNKGGQALYPRSATAHNKNRNRILKVIDYKL